MKLVKRRMVVHIELSPAEYSELTTHVTGLEVIYELMQEFVN